MSLQIGPAKLRSKILNKSDEWLWVLFEEKDRTKGRLLAPNSKVPDGIDAVAFTSQRGGVSINRYMDWLQLGSMSIVTVRTWKFSTLIAYPLPPTLLLEKTDDDFDEIHYNESYKWGVKLKPWE
jgi:hypothetical protein